MSTRTFPAESASLRAARAFVRERLESRTSADTLDRAVLAVSELATNVLLHVGGEFEVQVQTDGTIRLGVRDADPTPPVIQRGPVTALGGRGLAIVESICTRWGVSFMDGGKTVWCELTARPRAVR